MRSSLPLCLAVVCGCHTIEVFPFTSGIYAANAEGEWLDVRVEESLVVFYAADGALVDADGHVQGEEHHREALNPFYQEERGVSCGDGLAYEGASLDAMVMFQLGTTAFSWPYLVWDCDQVHLILSDHEDTLDCSGDGVCWRFEPRDP